MTGLASLAGQLQHARNQRTAALALQDGSWSDAPHIAAHNVHHQQPLHRLHQHQSPIAPSANHTNPLSLRDPGRSLGSSAPPPAAPWLDLARMCTLPNAAAQAAEVLITDGQQCSVLAWRMQDTLSSQASCLHGQDQGNGRQPGYVITTSSLAAGFRDRQEGKVVSSLQPSSSLSLGGNFPAAAGGVAAASSAGAAVHARVAGATSLFGVRAHMPPMHARSRPASNEVCLPHIARLCRVFVQGCYVAAHNHACIKATAPTWLAHCTICTL